MVMIGQRRHKYWQNIGNQALATNAGLTLIQYRQRWPEIGIFFMGMHQMVPIHEALKDSELYYHKYYGKTLQML